MLIKYKYIYCSVDRAITKTNKMKNLNTIKSEIKKQLGLDTFKIIERKSFKWGMESIKISIEKPRSTKIGLIWLNTDWETNSINGINLELEWC